MLEIYKKALLLSAKRWFIDKNEDWVLQEDNDPKHRSKLCTERKKRSGIVTLDWPSQSPDANSIKNVWAYIKHNLRGKRTYTLKQLSSYMEVLYRQFGRKHASEIPGNYRRR